MTIQQSIAEATYGFGTELIGRTVYFEAKKTVKIGPDRPAPGNQPYYYLIPGTVLATTGTGVVLQAAGGIYNRSLADIVAPGDLRTWIQNNPGKVVMRGDA